MKQPSLCVFGEVLFDTFENGSKVMGGAPFNLAWHLQAFGQHPQFISRVGRDTAGQTVRAAMSDWGMDDTLLQDDPTHATGSVQVSMRDGEPHYEIVEDRAYDFIDADAVAHVQCDLLYHGTLALRNPISARALQSIKSRHLGRVFVDVNLREPWWDRAGVLGLLDEAHWVKLNHHELDILYPGKESLEKRLHAFLDSYALDGVVLTLGEAGAMAMQAGEAPIEVSPVPSERVIDTVGAGDAFASVMILGILNDWPLRLSLQRAQIFASKLVERQGATVAQPAFYRPLIHNWHLHKHIWKSQ